MCLPNWYDPQGRPSPSRLPRQNSRPVPDELVDVPVVGKVGDSFTPTSRISHFEGHYQARRRGGILSETRG